MNKNVICDECENEILDVEKYTIVIYNNKVLFFHIDCEKDFRKRCFKSDNKR